jgi:hypothetical protein
VLNGSPMQSIASDRQFISYTSPVVIDATVAGSVTSSTTLSTVGGDVIVFSGAVGWACHNFKVHATSDVVSEIECTREGPPLGLLAILSPPAQYARPPPPSFSNPLPIWLLHAGTNLGPDCQRSSASMGTLALTLVACNVTTILASTPSGAGVAGSLSLTVGGQAAAIGGQAGSTFSYAPPAITALVRARVVCAAPTCKHFSLR